MSPFSIIVMSAFIVSGLKLLWCPVVLLSSGWSAVGQTFLVQGLPDSPQYGGDVLHMSFDQSRRTWKVFLVILPSRRARRPLAWIQRSLSWFFAVLRLLLLAASSFFGKGTVMAARLVTLDLGRPCFGRWDLSKEQCPNRGKQVAGEILTEVDLREELACRRPVAAPTALDNIASLLLGSYGTVCTRSFRAMNRTGQDTPGSGCLWTGDLLMQRMPIPLPAAEGAWGRNGRRRIPTEFAVQTPAHAAVFVFLILLVVRMRMRMLLLRGVRLRTSVGRGLVLRFSCQKLFLFSLGPVDFF